MPAAARCHPPRRVVLDVDQAVRQAGRGDWSVTEEIALLAIHGTLHLIGHDHVEMDEEQQMRTLEHDVLAALYRRHREVGWKPGSLFDRAGHPPSPPAAEAIRPEERPLSRRER